MVKTSSKKREGRGELQRPNKVMKFNRKRKSDYYCGTISFLALRALILSWSTTWNRRKGKFSEFFFSNWTKKRMNSNHHIIKDGNEVEAQWDPTLGEEKFSPNATHTHICIHMYVCMYIYMCMYMYIYPYFWFQLCIVSKKRPPIKNPSFSHS